MVVEDDAAAGETGEDPEILVQVGLAAETP